ncbi:MAG: acyl carrier protein [Gemmatimonadaceae bacterium]
MTAETPLQQVGAIIRDVLDKPGIEVNSMSSAADIPDWDSLSNVQLVVAIERHFKIRFTSDEIRSFHNVGEMCDCIETKIRGR